MRGASLLKWKMRRPKHRKLSCRIAVMKSSGRAQPLAYTNASNGGGSLAASALLSPGESSAISGDAAQKAGLLTPLISATAPQDMEPGLRPTLHERLPII